MRGLLFWFLSKEVIELFFADLFDVGLWTLFYISPSTRWKFHF